MLLSHHVGTLIGLAPIIVAEAHALMKAHQVSDSGRFPKIVASFTAYLDANHIIWRSISYDDREVVIINYLASMRRSPGCTRGAISIFIRAMSWEHVTSLSPSPNPILAPRVKHYLEAIEKSFPDTPRKRRVPFTSIMNNAINALTLAWASRGAHHYWRVHVLNCLDQVAGSRIGELISLKRKNLLILPTHFRIDFEKRKNKKRREANLVYISRAPENDLNCPHQALIQYLSRVNLLLPRSDSPTDIEHWENHFIFPGDEHRSTLGHITYKCVYDQLKRVCSTLGYDTHNYGWHSNRASVITTLQSRGMTDETISIYTGHRSTKSLQSYGQGTIEQRLGASQLLQAAPRL